MLRELHIENIAIIEKADIEFYNGFNVMTGETGAGKSIVIDSLNAVLGGRTTRDLVRHGAERATVTAVFDSDGVEDWLEENDIDLEDELIIQRKISAEGKSACRVSGVPVSVAQLRELGGMLLNIHGQNDGRQLMDEANHLKYLDAYGNYETEYAKFREAYEQYREIKRKIDKLSMDEDEKRRMIESLEYRVAELSKANLEEGEEAQLEARAEIMRNSEKLSENLGMAFGALYDGEINALGLISDAQYGVRRVLDYASDLSGAPDALEQARLLLEDVAEQLRDLLAELDFSPEEFDYIETRLAQLKKLQRKFGTDEAGLIEMLESSREKLEEMQSSDDLMQLYEKQAEQARAKTRKCAADLTKAREKAGIELAERIQKELSYLSMPSVKFVTEIVPVEAKDGFVSTGADDVRFLISANAGEKPGRISRIASGGELSRIMLAMKTVFAEADPVATLVFDEIDTGISGSAAQKVGMKLKEVSKDRQVMCVTHQAQIAALADSHFLINKEFSDNKTYTEVKKLDTQGRVRELARIIDGVEVTQTALNHAKKLIENA